MLVCEDSEVVFEGLHILNYGRMSGVWLLCFDIYCHDVGCTHHRRTPGRHQRREIFMTGSMWPVLRFHVVDTRSDERRNLVYTIPADVLTFGSLNERVEQGLIVTAMTRALGIARRQLQAFESSLAMVQNQVVNITGMETSLLVEANENDVFVGGL